MVVEDHEFQRRTILRILANLGTGWLLEAADGESALAQLSAEPRPDVVVCDLDMPGMDGVEFLRHVSERSIDTAIVIASGLGEGVLRSAEVTARAYGLHVLGAVAKPLTARRLLDVVGLHRPARNGAHAVASAAHTDAWTRALAEGAVRTLLRPRVDLLSGRPAGLQARAGRSEDNGSGQIAGAPDLPAAAPAALATALAELAFDGACRALRVLDATLPGLDITLLLPSGACADLTLADRFAARSGAADIDPGRICVAFPREPAVPDSAVQLDVLTRLLVRGFGLGVDGFTGGAVALGRLQELPLTEVALAPDALAGATCSRPGVEALDATIRALRERCARVVAAGCDSERQRDLLAQVGCDRAEGRIAGGAMSPVDLAAWAASQA
jgi:EAL domain-containing protein (putative c-di-GMP-specific phosphodiesterase class I)/AmiR/NasT family two-component response regulator